VLKLCDMGAAMRVASSKWPICSFGDASLGLGELCNKFVGSPSVCSCDHNGLPSCDGGNRRLASAGMGDWPVGDKDGEDAIRVQGEGGGVGSIRALNLL